MKTTEAYVLQQVREAVLVASADAEGISRLRGEDLRPETSLAEIGVDSVSAMEVAAYLEERLGIFLDQDAFAAGVRIGDLVQVLGERGAGEPAPRSKSQLSNV